MALKGSLEDFSIVNILQMIKLESKTGRLALSEDADTLKITFDEGSIIYAEGTAAKDEYRIQATLLANALVGAQEWNAIRQEHEERLKPYWELLAKAVSPQTLIELIQRQTIDTVYHALRWKKGSYEFEPMNKIKYNPKVMPKMDVDGLLMEGCRIADEWTRVTKALPPLDTFVVKNIMGENEEEDAITARAQGAAGGGDYRSSLEYEILAARGIQVNNAQIAVLSAMGQGLTIRELMDHARQGHFATLEAIQALLQMGVLKIAERKDKKRIAADHTGTSAQLVVVAALALILAAGAYWQYLSWPSSAAARAAGVTALKKIQAGEGLSKIAYAIRIHLALAGEMPKRLDGLVESGALEPADLTDPWGAPYQAVFEEGRLALFSTGPDVVLNTDNIYYAAD